MGQWRREWGRRDSERRYKLFTKALTSCFLSLDYFRCHTFCSISRARRWDTIQGNGTNATSLEQFLANFPTQKQFRSISIKVLSRLHPFWGVTIESVGERKKDVRPSASSCILNSTEEGDWCTTRWSSSYRAVILVSLRSYSGATIESNCVLCVFLGTRTILWLEELTFWA